MHTHTHTHTVVCCDTFDFKPSPLKQPTQTTIQAAGGELRERYGQVLVSKERADNIPMEAGCFVLLDHPNTHCITLPPPSTTTQQQVGYCQQTRKGHIASQPTTDTADNQRNSLS